MPKPTRSIDSRILRPRLHSAPPRMLALAALPLGLALALGVQAKQMKADAWVLCHGPNAVPPMQGEAPTGTAAQRETSAADAEADAVDVSQQHKSILKGHADLKRADQWLQADTITVDSDAGTYQADGSVRYQDSTVRLNASHGESHSKTDLTTLDNIQYQMLSERGNGTAAKGEVKGQVQTFTQVTYSTCDPTERKWEIRAQSMEINQDTHIGHARNATIRIGKVPVLYAPYLRFPTDNQRASGFLYPTIGFSDRNGFQLELPYYFNIAPNFDATITPRFLGRRGLMMEGEFRYLTSRSRGTIAGTYLPNDRVTGYDRGEISIKDLTVLSKHWYASADLHHVSDTHYFEDFSNRPYGAAIGLISSQAGIYGRGRHWDAGGYLQTWQVTDSTLPELLSPYRRVPDLYFRWQQPVADAITVGVKTEAVKFDHPVLGGGTRVDLYPYIAFPLERAAWYLRPELGYRYTAYHLDNGVSPGGNNSPTRGTAIFDVDAGAYFERDVTWFGKRFINTLEPRMFYLRVPYRDQTDIPIFDSQELTFGFPQLFRTNRFTGADRQSDANQLTTAVTTRLLDAEDGHQWLSASVGQIHYFDPPRVLLPGEVFVNRSNSAYVVDGDLEIDDHWSLGGSYQWDPKYDQTQLGSVRGQYRFGAGGVVNAAYRYRPGLVRQADLSFVYPISANWRLLGRWNYSFLDQSTLEALGGVEWESCCMAVRVLGRDYIRSTSGQRDLALFFEIELKGLGSFGRETGQLLDRDILGYTR